MTNIPSPVPGPRWTHESIIEAVRDFAGEFGHPPTVLDWDVWEARSRGYMWRVDRWQENRGRWPTTQTVQKRFGTWNAALEAAGFKAGKPGHMRIGRDGLATGRYA